MLLLKINFFSAALLALGVSAPSNFSAQAPAVRHGMVLDDLARIKRVSAPRLSPDGQWVAYTVSKEDTAEDKNSSTLWMTSWDAKQTIQLTFGKDSASDPQWSPDGRYLAFLSSREGGEAKGSQVWALDRRGGEAQQLTNVKEDLQDYRWSPDAKTLLLTLQTKEEPDAPKDGAKPKPPKPIVIDRFHFKQDREGFLSEKQPHLYLFDVAMKKLNKLTGGPVSGPLAFGEEDGVWSPNGGEIAFVSNQTMPDPDRFANPDIFVVDASVGASPRKLTTFTGQDGGPLAWSPDGHNILYRQGTSPHYLIYDREQLAMISAAGGAPVLLAPQLDQWMMGAPVMAPNGTGVLTEIADDRESYAAEIALDGSGKFKRLTMERGSASALDQAGGHIAMIWTTDSKMPEIVALENGSLRKLTHVNDALAATLELAPTKNIEARTHDKSEVHGLLTMPVGWTAGTKAPLILFIHGGPTSQDAHAFDASRQLFAAHGYAVLNVNYRGSTGRGEAYSKSIEADWGHKEVIDLLACVDAAIATGNIDAEKLGIGGWSYGGILTDYTIASSTRFKAASSGAGMGNLLGFYGIDQYILQYENELQPPWKNLELYVKLSYPFLHADRIKTPTLFMGGDKDFNVPLEGGEQMYQALKSVGTPAELIVYPGQFHGFTRPSFIKDRYQRWFDWYDKYVKGIVVPAPSVATPPAPSAVAPTGEAIKQ